MLTTVKLWLWLVSRLDIGPAWAVLNHFGSPEKAYCADRDEYRLVPGLTSGHRRQLAEKAMGDVDYLLARCDEAGIRILTWQDAEYPQLLRTVDLPPLVLYIRGKLPRLEDKTVISMAGTRKASPYGRMKAEEIARELTLAGALVVTGIVSGCDECALAGILQAGGAPVCIVAGGVDVPYYETEKHKDLLKEVAARGALISENPPGTPHRGELFASRNRILTGISRGSVCVEAPIRSGTLQVARLANDQGRDIFALIANADAPSSAGTAALLAQGEAIPIRDAEDILSHYPIFFPIHLRALRNGPEKAAVPETVCTEDSAPPSREEAADPRPILHLKDYESEFTDDERDILGIINEPLIPDVIAAATGIPARRVSSALTVLTIRGLVKELPGSRFQATVILE